MNILEGSIVRISTWGNVDCGKSTLAGYLRAKWDPSVPKEQHWSHLSDALEVERKLDQTICLAHNHFNSSNTRIHFIDDPGHSEYLAATLSGLFQSDIVLYIIDPTDFSANVLEKRIALLNWISKRNILFVINACDKVAWDDSILTTIEQSVRALPDQKDAQIVRISLLQETNIVSSHDGMEPLMVAICKSIEHHWLSIKSLEFKNIIYNNTDQIEWYFWGEEPLSDKYIIYYRNQTDAHHLELFKTQLQIIKGMHPLAGSFFTSHASLKNILQFDPWIFAIDEETSSPRAIGKIVK